MCLPLFVGLVWLPSVHVNVQLNSGKSLHSGRYARFIDKSSEYFIANELRTKWLEIEHIWDREVEEKERREEFVAWKTDRKIGSTCTRTHPGAEETCW